MTIVGVDFGEKRVGIAISDPAGSFAMPLEVAEVNSTDMAIMKIVRICREREADRLVIGLPLSMNGERGPMARHVETVCDKLRKVMSIPIVPWDERLSTAAAARVLREASLTEKEQRHKRDKIAAQLVLQAYLDSLPLNNVSDHEP